MKMDACQLLDAAEVQFQPQGLLARFADPARVIADDAVNGFGWVTVGGG